jgi:hypothetical protein
LAIVDLFSKRQKKLQGEVPDVYVYDELPYPLRVQIIYIWLDTLGNVDQYDRGENDVPQAYKTIVEVLCREYGVFSLDGRDKKDDRHYLRELVYFFLYERDLEKVLDPVELSFWVIGNLGRADVIEELNARFREHGVGYQFVDGQIIRIDSELIHAEVVMPALALLYAREYAGAQEEFLKAHEHYRHGNGKEALAECLKAFESVRKVICGKRKRAHGPNATSSTLIQVYFGNGLIPSFWQSDFSALRSLLEGGVPTARNKLGGHGQGSAVVEVPSYLVGYVLHMRAASIVFLVEAEQQLK